MICRVTRGARHFEHESRAEGHPLALAPTLRLSACAWGSFPRVRTIQARSCRASNIDSGVGSSSGARIVRGPPSSRRILPRDVRKKAHLLKVAGMTRTDVLERSSRIDGGKMSCLTKNVTPHRKKPRARRDRGSQSPRACWTTTQSNSSVRFLNHAHTKFAFSSRQLSSNLSNFPGTRRRIAWLPQKASSCSHSPVEAFYLYVIATTILEMPEHPSQQAAATGAC